MNFVPNPPKYLRADAIGQNSINLSWQADYTDVQSSIVNIIGYKVTVQEKDGTHFNTYEVSGEAATHYSVNNLLPGQDYQFIVQAKNAVGYSSNSAALTFTTLEGTPLPPFLDLGEVSGTNITVTWQAQHNGGSPITNYKISYWDASNTGK